MESPAVLEFSPPTDLLRVDDAGNAVVDDPLRALEPGLRAAIENPWNEGRYLVGTVRGLPGKFLLEVGASLGMLKKDEEKGTYVCLGLARMEAIAEGLALEEAEKAKTFTQRLLSKASKKGKRR